jgi:hypothetical protein
MGWVKSPHLRSQADQGVPDFYPAHTCLIARKQQAKQWLLLLPRPCRNKA